MKYFLVGYMACGKSRYGKEMAQRLGIRFIDLDEYIVNRERCSIAAIFSEHGEERFRKLETRYLHEVCELYENFVLSTGGGTPCFNGNMSYVNERGETIFLNTDIEVIINRLKNNRQKRPLISRLSEKELRTYVIEHFKERESFYRLAQKMITP